MKGVRLLHSPRTPNRWRVVAAAIVAACAFARPAHADEPPPDAATDAVELPATLTLDAALSAFKRRGFDLLIAESAVEGAKGDLRAAGALHNPTVTAGIGRSFAYGPSCAGCSSPQWQAGISDDAAIADVVFGKRGLRVKVAKAALEAAKMARVDAERTLTFAVKQQYSAVVLAKAGVDFAKQARASSAETANLIDVRYKAGAATEVDVARVQTALLEADQAVDAAERDLRLAKVGMAYLLGVRGVVPEFDVAPTPARSAVPKPLEGATRDSLVRTALEARPDLKAQVLLRERAEASIALAKRQNVPDVALSLNYAQQGSGDAAITPPTLTFGVSLPLPILYQSQGEIARARADFQTAALQTSKTEAQVVSDVENAYAAFSTARKRVERMESGGLLEMARKAKDLTAVQYQKGASSLLEVLDAQRTFIATNQEYLQDLTDFTNALFSLEQAIGTELR
jgi:cobalt-zinc-cadmium efflux system outer membrane protein